MVCIDRLYILLRRFEKREASGFRMSGKTALITGITGQDGSYLAELLLDKDWCAEYPSQVSGGISLIT